MVRKVQKLKWRADDKTRTKTAKLLVVVDGVVNFI